MEYKTVRELYEIVLNNNHIELDQLKDIELLGWIKTNRFNGSIGFIELNDGSYFKNIQLVYDSKLKDIDKVSKYLTGCAIGVWGCFKLTLDSKQPFELLVKDIVLHGDCSSDYPLQKKRHSFEYLREIAHLRPRTNTFNAVFRVRSLLSMAIHEFFQSQGFVYLHAPIITSNDAEGAGESFIVTNRSDDKYDEDYFGKKASLSVSGQLHAEAYALAFRDVYTFGPTFRAEYSNTTTHCSEFWMIEPEMAFADIDDNMSLIEDMIKYCISYILVNAKEEMRFFDEFIEKDLISKLQDVLNSEFVKMTYSEAIDHLLKADKKFEFPVEWGQDLKSEHEKYICEEVVCGPVFIIDYPKDIKSFYMRINDDGKTVSACDLLVPRIGELVGGSQREERLEILQKRMKDMNIDDCNLDWYLDLRRYGGCKHAGFGLGFERFIMYITGMTNIRDVIPFARTPRNLHF